MTEVTVKTLQNHDSPAIFCERPVNTPGKHKYGMKTDWNYVRYSTQFLQTPYVGDYGKGEFHNNVHEYTPSLTIRENAFLNAWNSFILKSEIIH